MVVKKTGSRSLGMFVGVFVPTFLTIMGVILFLRLGFIVGAGGVLPALLIIFLATSVTIATGLSLSSITTNIKIGAGGVYSIVSKTLGMEIGGSVGIPLFLAQVFSVALYLFGFTEVWRYIFPDHPKILVVAGAFILILLLTYTSTKWALKAQIFVFAILVASIISVFAGGGWWTSSMQIPLIGSFEGTDFWKLFALFFPAVTGLMAGIGMSGELTNPKKQIPRGVLTALGVTTVVYMVMVFWFAFSTSPGTLLGNNLAIVELAAFSPLVLAGILASTFSSALTTAVAAPRIMQAMSDNSLLPFSDFLARKTKRGEPKHAIMVTAFLLAIVLLSGGIDAVAPVLTMIFLWAYALINMVVFIEQSMGLVSYRPTFRIPRFVPFYGMVASVVFAFYINLIAGIMAFSLLVLTYLFLVHRNLKQTEGTVRSGLFIAISEWAAKKVISLAESKEHIWKPNFLLPVIDTRNLEGSFPVVKSIAYPDGTLSVLGMNLKSRKLYKGSKLSEKEMKEDLKMIPGLVKKFSGEGVFTNYSEIKADDFDSAINVSLQAVRGQVFHPNMIFLPIHSMKLDVKGIGKLIRTAKRTDAGVVLFNKDLALGLGSEEDIHVWMPSILPEDDEGFHDFVRGCHFDLALLVAYKIYKNWAGNIHLRMCVEKKQEDAAKAYLRKLVQEARFPPSTDIQVYTDTLNSAMRKVQGGDIHIMPVKDLSDLRRVMRSTEKISRTYLFVMDSGLEDVLA